MKESILEARRELAKLLKLEEELNEKPDSKGEKPGQKIKETEINFSAKPEELETFLNKYVINQKEAIEIIATKVCTHFNRMNLETNFSDEEKLLGKIKSNILLIGPTGIGKTYIIKLIAKRIGVPFVKADATKFSETGYVGGDVEDLVRELVHEADGDIKKAEYGIIYIDEIDKIASSGSYRGIDVSRTGVQRNLLKLMEDSDVDLKTPHDLASQVEAAMEAQKKGKISRKKINTKNILFIVSGAFNGLNEIIDKRINKKNIGFAGSQKTIRAEELLKEIRTEDLINFGFESEFIGRLPVYVALNNLDEDSLFQILKNNHSTVILGKKLDFKSYGIDLNFTEEALKILAQRAYLEKTGARGLLTVFEQALIKFEKHLPSTEIKELLVDEELLSNPQTKLNNLMIKNGIQTFQKNFLVTHGIFLNFEKEAKQKIQAIYEKTGQSPSQICHTLFENYSHGLRLMKLESFTITLEAVLNPKDFLDNYIKNNYQENPKSSE